jgi:multidrug efflux pump
VARNSIGVVLVGGMTIGTFFTLFVVPCLYVLIAKDHRGQRTHEAARVPVESGAPPALAPVDLGGGLAARTAG